uniref:Peroxidase n=1 Tax=Rhabditophanes sp. KR3021 TaxID=114890 RepID=A0AC35TYU2_9BILA
MVKLRNSDLYTSSLPTHKKCCDPNNTHLECLTLESADITSSKSDQCYVGAREQMNVGTSFIDAGIIYGNTLEEQTMIRTFESGRIKETINPTKSTTPTDNTNLLHQTTPVLRAVLIRNHNKLAKGLGSINRDWSDEKIFQEVRKIVVAQIQFVTLNEFVPILIGHDSALYFNLIVSKFHDDEVNLKPFYELSSNANSLNSFASAAGLFYYTMMVQTGTKPFEFSNSSNTINAQTTIEIDETFIAKNVDKFLSHLVSTKVSRPGLHINPAYLRKNFGRVGFSSDSLHFTTLLIQLSRDHGLPSYSAFRDKCGLPQVKNLDDLTDQLLNPKIVIPILQKYFKSIDDVDLILLGLAEKPVRGGLVGPTFACIIGKQFMNVRNGDKFWFDNTKNSEGLSFSQIKQIRKTTLSKLICAAFPSIKTIPSYAFQIPSNEYNFPLACSTLTSNKQFLNLKYWKDSSEESKCDDDADKIRRFIDSDIGPVPILNAKLRDAYKLAEDRYFIKKEKRSNYLNTLASSINDKKYLEKNTPLSGCPVHQYKEYGEEKVNRQDPNSPIKSYSRQMHAQTESLRKSDEAHILQEAFDIIKNNEIDVFDREHRFFDIQPNLELKQIPMIPLFNQGQMIQSIQSQSIVSDTIKKGVVSEVVDCIPHLPCDSTHPYRIHSGWCNNLANPDFGNAFGPLKHLLPPAYEDGISKVRSKATSGRQLPVARKVSTTLNSGTSVSKGKYTHLLMQFGQFLDHDMSHVPISQGVNGSALDCTACDSETTVDKDCFPMPIPKDDPHFPSVHKNGQPRCFHFVRSILGSFEKGFRNQMSQLTPYIDSSTVYGSDLCQSFTLRTNFSGLLLFDSLSSANNESVPMREGLAGCRSAPQFRCFLAGDFRVSHSPGLTTLHTYFLRQHNHFAKQFANMNPGWTDEILYQEARKLNGALMQHFTFNEFLPAVLGKANMNKFGLTLKSDGYYTDYDPTCDATVSHPFTVGAFRFGHSLIRQTFNRFDGHYKNLTAPELRVADTFDDATSVYDNRGLGIDGLLLGFLGSAAMDVDRFITKHLTNFLFARPNDRLSGLDLFAINIQRGRDHGLQPYNVLRKMCGRKKARNFKELEDDMDPEALARLMVIYDHVDDIDLFPGLISEKTMEGALVSPTTACILSEQFKRSRKCDRFWYENDGQFTKFKPAQLDQIRKMTLARLFCDYSKTVTKVQPNVFLMPDDLTNAQIACEYFPKMDLSQWSNSGVCKIKNKMIGIGETARQTPCTSCKCTTRGLRCEAIKIKHCQQLIDKYRLKDIIADSACILQCPQIGID